MRCEHFRQLERIGWLPHPSPPPRALGGSHDPFGPDGAQVDNCDSLSAACDPAMWTIWQTDHWAGSEGNRGLPFEVRAPTTWELIQYGTTSIIAQEDLGAPPEVVAGRDNDCVLSSNPFSMNDLPTGCRTRAASFQATETAGAGLHTCPFSIGSSIPCWYGRSVQPEATSHPAGTSGLLTSASDPTCPTFACLQPLPVPAGTLQATQHQATRPSARSTAAARRRWQLPIAPRRLTIRLTPRRDGDSTRLRVSGRQTRTA